MPDGTIASGTLGETITYEVRNFARPGKAQKPLLGSMAITARNRSEGSCGTTPINISSNHSVNRSNSKQQTAAVIIAFP